MPKNNEENKRLQAVGITFIAAQSTRKKKWFLLKKIDIAAKSKHHIGYQNTFSGLHHPKLICFLSKTFTEYPFLFTYAASLELDSCGHSVSPLQSYLFIKIINFCGEMHSQQQNQEKRALW